MIILSWNVRGLNRPHMQREIKDLIISSNPDILFILESRIRFNNLHAIGNDIFPRNWNNFSNATHTNSARIWVAWKQEIDLAVIHSQAQLILCELNIPSVDTPLCLVAIYGFNNPTFRMDPWKTIQLLSRRRKEPSIFIGDYNCIRGTEERSGGGSPNLCAIGQFNNCIEDSNLIDFKISGADFSWSNSSHGVHRTETKNDGILVNQEFMNSACLKTTSSSLVIPRKETGGIENSRKNLEGCYELGDPP